MPGRRRLPRDVVAAVRDGKIVGIRAGTQPHRFIGTRAVVVEGRVFGRDEVGAVCCAICFPVSKTGTVVAIR
jgi:hypothetical protein